MGSQPRTVKESLINQIIIFYGDVAKLKYYAEKIFLKCVALALFDALCLHGVCVSVASILPTISCGDVINLSNG